MKSLTAIQARRLLLLIVFFIAGFLCGMQIDDWQQMLFDFYNSFRLS